MHREKRKEQQHRKIRASGLSVPPVSRKREKDDQHSRSQPGHHFMIMMMMTYRERKKEGDAANDNSVS